MENITDATDGGKITLEQAPQNPDGGMPTSMYQALAAAEKHGLIDGESRWDEGITKAEALAMITTVYEDAKLSDSVEFEAADVNKNTQTENNQQQTNPDNPNLEKIAEHVFVLENGEIGCSVDLANAIESELARQGLGKSYGVQILNSYYHQVKDKDNTKIYDDAIENAVDSLKDALKGSNQNKGNSSNKDNSNQNNNDSNNNKQPQNDNEGSNGGESLPPSDDNSGIDDSTGVTEDPDAVPDIFKDKQGDVQDWLDDEEDDSTDGGTFG